MINSGKNEKINAVAKFEKVAFDQFYKDLEDLHFDMELPLAFKFWEELQLPTRATAGSGGYDFYCPFDLMVEGDGSSVTIPTGIRAKIDDGWELLIYPRSGLGFKYRISFDNTIPLIDQDYYDSSNQGHIMLKLHKKDDGTDVRLYRGTRFAQGNFIPFGITYDDAATAVRDGGMGSTGLK